MERYEFVIDHAYNVFLQNFTTFAYITRLFDRKIECTLEFEDDIRLDCGKIILSKILMMTNSMKLLYNIPADNIINSTSHFKLKQISIKIILENYDKYEDFRTSFFIYFYNSIFLSYLPNEIQSKSIYLSNMNTFIVEPIYLKRLTHFRRQCDPRVKPLFDDSLTDDCIMDCVRKRSIDEYNCIPFKKSFGFIRWKRDILENHYILCNQSYNKEIIIDTFIHKCINKCQLDCELGLYKITQFYDYNYNSIQNIIPIKIIPRSNLIVQYEEQYVMDGWELIYQLGGVVGMWVGWSALSISSIMTKLFVITNISKYYFLKIKSISYKTYILVKIHYRSLSQKLKTFLFTLFIVISKCLINCMKKII